MRTDFVGKCLGALVIGTLAGCFVIANGMFYEEFVAQLHEWAAGQTPMALSATTFYR